MSTGELLGTPQPKSRFPLPFLLSDVHKGGHAAYSWGSRLTNKGRPREVGPES